MKLSDIVFLASIFSSLLLLHALPLPQQAGATLLQVTPITPDDASIKDQQHHARAVSNTITTKDNIVINHAYRNGTKVPITKLPNIHRVLSAYKLPTAKKMGKALSAPLKKASDAVSSAQDIATKAKSLNITSQILFGFQTDEETTVVQPITAVPDLDVGNLLGGGGVLAGSDPSDPGGGGTSAAAEAVSTVINAVVGVALKSTATGTSEDSEADADGGAEGDLKRGDGAPVQEGKNGIKKRGVGDDSGEVQLQEEAEAQDQDGEPVDGDQYQTQNSKESHTSSPISTNDEASDPIYYTLPSQKILSESEHAQLFPHMIQKSTQSPDEASPSHNLCSSIIGGLPSKTLDATLTALTDFGHGLGEFFSVASSMAFDFFRSLSELSREGGGSKGEDVTGAFALARLGLRFEFPEDENSKWQKWRELPFRIVQRGLRMRE